MALNFFNWLQLVGIFGEVAVAGLGFGIGARSKSSSGWLIGASFFLYALYDFIQLGRALSTWLLDVPDVAISIIYFVAVVLMVIGAWIIYKAL